MKNSHNNRRNRIVVSSIIGLGVNVFALLSTAVALTVSVTELSQPASSESVPESNDVAPTSVRLAQAPATPLAGYYAAPNGSPNGDGSLQQPWDLQTVLKNGNGPNRVVRPGDTIWLRGGTYRAVDGIRSNLLGAPGAPITVRPYPGERAIIDLNNIGDPRAPFVVASDGGWTNYQGFEVTNSAPGRRYSSGRPRDYAQEDKGNVKGNPSGLVIHAPNTKLINLIVHDNVGTGMGFWVKASDSEIYGCLVYNNGISKFEHGIYAHNTTGFKRIADNIIFNQTGMGISVHNANPNNAPNLRGFDIEGNIAFNNGSILPAPMAPGARGKVTYYNILVGMGSPVEDLRLVNNFTYYSQPGEGLVRLGSGQNMTSRNLVAQNNYFVEAMELIDWTGTNVSNNIIVAGRTPTETKVYVRPNKYEPGRANIVVYNWRRQNTVTANIATAGLKTGQQFEVRNAQDFFAPPVLTGTYNGQSIVLPMTGLSVAPTVGPLPQRPQPTGPTFNVFVVQPLQTAFKLS